MVDGGHEGKDFALVIIQRGHWPLAERTDVPLADDLHMAFITIAHTITSFIQRIGHNGHVYAHGGQCAEKTHLDIGLH